MKTGGVWIHFEGRPWRWRPLPSIGHPNRSTRNEALRQAINTPVQGGGAEYCLASLIKIVELCLTEWKDIAIVVGTVHDSIMLEVREKYALRVAAKGKQVMESFESKGVPLIADVGIGRRWDAIKAVDPKELRRAA
jgi:DNA polymerase-1